MKKEQEKACDELVLKAGVKPSTYEKERWLYFYGLESEKSFEPGRY